MKNVIRLSLAILISSFLSGTPAAKGQAAQIDSFLKVQIIAHSIPGMSVAIIENGKVAYMQSYGMANIEHEIPVTQQTAFQLASVTKLLTLLHFLLWSRKGNWI